MSEQKSWETTARAVQRENRRDLKALPGHFVIVRKFNIKAQERLGAMKERMKTDEAGIPVDMNEGEMASFYKEMIADGVLEGNFLKEDGSLESFQDDRFLDKLIDHGELTDEIIEHVTKYNAPLLKKSSEASATSPNGSIAEPSIEKERHIRTVATPAS